MSLTSLHLTPPSPARKVCFGRIFSALPVMMDPLPTKQNFQ